MMVTHESDIAAYAQRNVVMRDGLVLNDLPWQSVGTPPTKWNDLQHRQGMSANERNFVAAIYDLRLPARA